MTVDGEGSFDVTLSHLDRTPKSAYWVDNEEALEMENLGDNSCRITLTANPYGSNHVVRVFRML